MKRLDFVPKTQFKIFQDSDFFCYGTDALLLADFALEKNHCIKQNSLLADLGTGNAIIPLILSSKVNVKKIFALELQKSLANLAQENVLLNNLSEKISVIHTDVKNAFNFSEIKKNSFDAVLTNPPYLKFNDGEKNLKTELSIARHQQKDTNENFIKTASLMLKSQGNFFMINRASYLSEFIFLLKKYKLEVKHLKMVHPNPKKNATMVLVHAVKAAKAQLIFEPPVFVN